MTNALKMARSIHRRVFSLLLLLTTDEFCVLTDGTVVSEKDCHADSAASNAYLTGVKLPRLNNAFNSRQIPTAVLSCQEG